MVVDSQESKRWLKFGSGVYVLHDICELASSRDGFVFEFVWIRSDKNKVAYSLAKWVEKYWLKVSYCLQTSMDLFCSI